MQRDQSRAAQILHACRLWERGRHGYFRSGFFEPDPGANAANPETETGGEALGCLGLRTSRFDRFWPLAMSVPFGVDDIDGGAEPWCAHRLAREHGLR